MTATILIMNTGNVTVAGLPNILFTFTLPAGPFRLNSTTIMGTSSTTTLRQLYDPMDTVLARMNTSLAQALGSIASALELAPPSTLCEYDVCPDVAAQVGALLGYVETFYALACVAVVMMYQAWLYATGRGEQAKGLIDGDDADLVKGEMLGALGG